MEINEALIQSIAEVFPLFKMKPQFKNIEEKKLLSSADQVNVLNSFSQTLQGNIVFGFSRAQGLRIASLVKGMAVQSFDSETKTAIGEIVTLSVNVAMSKFKVVNFINISPPMIVTGDNLFLMISRVKTTKLLFQLGDDLLSVAYCIEQNSEIGQLFY
jgi:CheY-specific phosphatase CheX